MKQLGYIVADRVRALFGVTAILIASAGCGTQITSLRQAVSGNTSSAYSNPPDVTSLTIANVSPTSGNPLQLNWGIPFGTHTHYCLLENASDPSTCIWRTGSLPTTYADSASDGLLELTAFLKNPAGVSAPVISNTVMIDRTAPELASVTVTNSSPTNNATFSLSYGAVSNAPYSQYCILENNISIGSCAWQTGSLPASFAVTATDGAKNLSVWIRDDAGNTSTRVFTGAITLDLTVPTVAISNPAAGTYITPANVASFAVNGTCSEDGSNVVISGAASATVVCSGLNWSANLDFTAAPQGSASISVAHSDAAGNAATPATRTFTKDTALPTVAISAPAAGTSVLPANLSSFTVSGTCSENTRNVVITGDAAATVACAAGAWSANLDFTAASQGSVTILVNHSDAAGNAATQDTRTFTKDTVLPTVAFSTPAAGSSVNSGNVAAFAVTGTCSENGRNVVLSGAASSTVVCTAGAWSASLDFTAAADGTVTVYADHSDAAGNAATQASRAFTKDVLPPSVDIDNPAALASINAANVSSFTVDGSCSENTRNVVISGDASATVACTAGAWTANLNFSAAAQGSVSIDVNHSDAGGNAAPQASRSFTKDTVVPTVAISNPAAGTSIYSVNLATFAVDGTCSENTRNVVISGDASTTVACTAGAWSASLDFTSASDGPVSINVNHADAAGNPATQATRSFNKDTGLPTLTIATPAANSYINIANVAAYAVTGTCSENTRNVVISGAASATVTCTAGAWSANLDFTAAAQGNATINVNHSDAGGNAANQVSRTFIKDTILPALGSTTPQTGTFYGGQSISIGWSVTDANLGATPIVLEWTSNGWVGVNTIATAQAASGTYSFTVPSINTVNFVIRARAVDLAGNSEADASFDMVIDSTVPTVAISTPAANSYINAADVAAYAVTGTCSENTRNVVISGAASATVTCTAGAWSANLDFTAAAQGNATINVNHSDAAGNNAVQASRTFIKDTVLPAITLSDPLDDPFAGGQSVNVVWSSTDTNIGSTPVAIYWSTDAFATVNTAILTAQGPSGTYAWTIPSLNTNTFQVRAWATDLAGNTDRDTTPNMIVDSTAPTVAISAPAASSYVSSANVSAYAVNGTCSENTQNVVISGDASATVVCTAGAWSANLDFTAAAQGNVTINVNHSDAVGNAATTASRIFVKDTVAPTLASVTVTNTSPTNTTSYALTFGAVTNGPYTDYCLLENTTLVTGCAWISGTAAGPYTVDASNNSKTISAYLRDAAGNISAVVTSNSVDLDTVLPTVAVTSPADGTTITNVAAWSVSGTCSENGRNVVITGDASATVVCTAGAWSTNLDFTAAAAGTVSIAVDHSDSAGNAAVQDTHTFVKLPLPGVFAISSATPGNTDVTLAWAASSDATTYEVSYGTVSGTYGTTFSTNATSPTVVTGLTNGTTYYFMVTAVNATGERDASAQASATPHLVVAVTGPATLSTGICSSSAYTAQIQLPVGTAYNVPANLSVDLTSAAGTTFYDSTDTACTGTPITSLVVASGTPSKTFYAKAMFAQTADITATVPLTGYVSSALSVTSSWNPTRIDLVAGTRLGVGSADGIGTAARFNLPGGTAIDTANNLLYVSDTANCTIRKIDLATSTVTTIAGVVGTCTTADGSGTGQTPPNATFSRAHSLTYDGSRYLYVGDYASCSVRRVDTVSPYTTTSIVSGGCSSGTVGDGTGAGSRLGGVRSIFYHANKLYVTERYHTVRMIDLSLAPTSTSFVTTMAGGLNSPGMTDANGTAARFDDPTGMAADATYLYVADGGNESIRKITLAAPYTVTTVSASTTDPVGMVLSGTDLYYQSASRFRRISVTGTGNMTIIGGFPAAYDEIGDRDGPNGTAHFNMSGLYGSSVSADATYLYFADRDNNAIKKTLLVSPYTTTTVAGFGNKGNAVTDDPVGSNARFGQLNSGTTDGTSLYLGEGLHGNVVRKVNLATGATSTLAGAGFTRACTDGASTVARFHTIRSMVYRAGLIYLFDEGCSGGVIRTVDATTGATTTLASTAGLVTGAYLMAIAGDRLFLSRYNSFRIASIDLTDPAYPVVNVAGTGSSGNGTGAALTTAIGRTGAMWASNTTLYWFDSSAGRIKMLDYTASNTITSLAGNTSGANPVADGTGTGITFDGLNEFGGMTGDSQNLYVLDHGGTFLRRINLSTGVSDTMIGNASKDYWLAIRNHLEQDGPISTATTASMVNGNQFLIMNTNGLFIGTKFGIRWLH